jgi:hypothetical protein
MDDINKPENTNVDADKTQETMPTPSHTFIDASNKYGSDFHPNTRIDIKSNARLDDRPPVFRKPGFDGTALAVLQWLSYALWGLTVIAISVMAVAVLSFFITGSSIGDSINYSMAAVFVLLPLSLIFDLMYIKNEPETKSRISSVITIIHAVIFALLGVGSLIAIAFSIVSLIVSSSGHDSIMVTLYSSLIIAFLFLLLFLQTVLPKSYTRVRYLFILVMLISVVTVCVYAITGPVADAQLTRNDNLIETNLPTVGDAVNTYASDNDKLPPGLVSLDLTGDAKVLVTNKLVTYIQDNPPISNYDTSSKTFYYELCVTYKKASSDQYATPVYATGATSSSSASSSYVSADDGYSTYVSTTPHPAGYKCYKLTTDDYSVVPMTSTNN